MTRALLVLLAFAAVCLTPSSPAVRAQSQNPGVPAGASIAGLVRDARGQPAPRAAVVLMQLVGNDRQFARMSDAANAGAVVRTEADSQGAYRLYGLPRGDYIVRATTMSHAPDRAPIVSRSFYPASADAAGASVVSLQADQELSGIDIQLGPASLVNVSGSVVWPQMNWRPRIRLLMFPAGLFARPEFERDGQAIVESPDGLFSNPVPVRSDGGFMIEGVPPGRYELWARSTPENVTATDDAGPAVWGRVEVAVGAQDLAGIVIAAAPPPVISGRVRADASTPPPDWRRGAGASVDLAPIEPPGVRSRALRVPARINPDGTFRLTGATPGRYRLELTMPDPGWALSSARAGGVDLLSAPIEIGSDTTIAEIDVVIARVQRVAR